MKRHRPVKLSFLPENEPVVTEKRSKNDRENGVGKPILKLGSIEATSSKYEALRTRFRVTWVSAYICNNWKVEVQDETGTAIVHVWNELIGKFQSILKVGEVFEMEYFKIVDNAVEWRRSPEQRFRLLPSSATKFVQVEDDGVIPKIKFNRQLLSKVATETIYLESFVDGSDPKIIQNQSPLTHKDEFDLICVLIQVSELIRLQKDSMILRKLILIDESKEIFTFQLWGWNAQYFDGDVGDVYLFKHCQAVQYVNRSITPEGQSVSSNEVQLKLNGKTGVVMKNPEFEGMMKLKMWYGRHAEIIKKDLAENCDEPETTKTEANTDAVSEEEDLLDDDHEDAEAHTRSNRGKHEVKVIDKGKSHKSEGDRRFLRSQGDKMGAEAGRKKNSDSSASAA